MEDKTPNLFEDIEDYLSGNLDETAALIFEQQMLDDINIQQVVIDYQNMVLRFNELRLHEKVYQIGRETTTSQKKLANRKYRLGGFVFLAGILLFLGLWNFNTEVRESAKEGYEEENSTMPCKEQILLPDSTKQSNGEKKQNGSGMNEKPRRTYPLSVPSTRIVPDTTPAEIKQVPLDSNKHNQVKLSMPLVTRPIFSATDVSVNPPVEKKFPLFIKFYQSPNSRYDEATFTGQYAEYLQKHPSVLREELVKQKLTDLYHGKTDSFENSLLQYHLVDTGNVAITYYLAVNYMEEKRPLEAIPLLEEVFSFKSAYPFSQDAEFYLALCLSGKDSSRSMTMLKSISQTYLHPYQQSAKQVLQYFR
ncbi:hypothetical protein C7N43_27210 [Sphingobacteriales bacterium UPWRP_1]|nr:hypothetical protein C7N43_27210 [Sphingobacteriales bacterium UPWRP_1]